MHPEFVTYSKSYLLCIGYANKRAAMYNISQGNSATKGNELGIFEGIGDVYAQEDLDLFFSTLYSYVNTYIG
jgi:hypothetical protein